MKHLLIGLIAFALTLGVACKKDAVVQPESSVSKKELSAKDLVKPVTSAVLDGVNGGAVTYPHSTGLCYCGKYSVCHPVMPGHQPGCTGYVPITGQLPGGSGPCRCSMWP